MLAHAALSKYGMSWAVPKVEGIFKHPTFGTGFLMEQVHGGEIFANYLQKYFNWVAAVESNDRLIIEVMAQLCIYLCILEDALQMNHRDLKSSNVLMIQKAEKPFILG